MVRGAERAGAKQPDVARQHARDRMNLGGFERFFGGHIGDDRRQALGKHTFTRTGRSDEQHVMHPGGGNFECATGGLLTHDVSKIEQTFRRFDRFGRSGGNQLFPTDQVR